MSKQGDYLPPQEAALIDWGDNFVAEITEHGTEWEIPAAEGAGVTTALAAFKALHVKAVSPEKSPVIIEEKNEARDDFKAKVRAMVKFRFANPAITNADRVRCGLHPRDTVKTPVGDPATVPVIAELHPLGNSRVEIRAHDEATPDSRAIPYGYNGCLLRYAFGPERVTGHAALTQSTLMTRFPFTLVLPPEASGQRLSCAACWQNEQGHLGQPSEIQSVVIA
jgi:phosphoribosylformylglycinamidine (FGAM) synthase PurS component